MEEIWKDIEGYVGFYQISNLGNVKSLERIVIRNGIAQKRKERIMSKRKNDDGYYIAKLNLNKISKSISIHRLVAQAFIPNPLNLPEVNHKDCNRTNNCVNNLEWCTHTDNIQHSAKLGRYPKRFGSENPNYGNHSLHNKYIANQELRKLQSRPKDKNGMAKRIEMLDLNMNPYKTFEWIGECSEYLIKNNITRSNSINSVRTAISLSIKKNKKYYNYYFRFI